MAQSSTQNTERVMANSVFNLMRRLPPNQVAKSLAGIGQLIEDEAFKQQLFDQVDQPLEVETCTATGKPFLKHEYNRDGDSYRSPWSNTYYPASPDATFFPSEQLLSLEQKANEVFATYVQLYYDYATSSVYFNDTDQQGFNACFLVQKIMDPTAEIKSGTWDAIHIVVCNMKEAPKVTYKVISTVMVSLEMIQPNGVGNMSIHGSSSKSASEQVTLPNDFGSGTDPNDFHVATIGRLIEANEDLLRSTVNDTYISKQRQVTNTGRLLEEYMTENERNHFQEMAQKGLLLGEAVGKAAGEETYP